MALSPEINYSRIPEVACVIPQYILVTYLGKTALAEHIDFMRKRQAEVMDAYIDSKTRSDKELDVVMEAAKDLNTVIKEEAIRSKEARKQHPTATIKTDKL